MDARHTVTGPVPGRAAHAARVAVPGGWLLAALALAAVTVAVLLVWWGSGGEAAGTPPSAQHLTVAPASGREHPGLH